MGIFVKVRCINEGVIGELANHLDFDKIIVEFSKSNFVKLH